MADLKNLLTQKSDEIQRLKTGGLNAAISKEEFDQDINTVVDTGKLQGKDAKTIENDIVAYKQYNDPAEPYEFQPYIPPEQSVEQQPLSNVEVDLNQGPQQQPGEEQQQPPDQDFMFELEQKRIKEVDKNRQTFESVTKFLDENIGDDPQKRPMIENLYPEDDDTFEEIKEKKKQLNKIAMTMFDQVALQKRQEALNPISTKIKDTLGNVAKDPGKAVFRNPITPLTAAAGIAVDTVVKDVNKEARGTEIGNKILDKEVIDFDFGEKHINIKVEDVTKLIPMVAAVAASSWEQRRAVSKFNEAMSKNNIELAKNLFKKVSPKYQAQYQKANKLLKKKLAPVIPKIYRVRVNKHLDRVYTAFETFIKPKTARLGAVAEGFAPNIKAGTTVAVPSSLTEGGKAAEGSPIITAIVTELVKNAKKEIIGAVVKMADDRENFVDKEFIEPVGQPEEPKQPTLFDNVKETKKNKQGIIDTILEQNRQVQAKEKITKQTKAAKEKAIVDKAVQEASEKYDLTTVEGQYKAGQDSGQGIDEKQTPSNPDPVKTSSNKIVDAIDTVINTTLDREDIIRKLDKKRMWQERVIERNLVKRIWNDNWFTNWNKGLRTKTKLTDLAEMQFQKKLGVQNQIFAILNYILKPHIKSQRNIIVPAKRKGILRKLQILIESEKSVSETDQTRTINITSLTQKLARAEQTIAFAADERKGHKIFKKKGDDKVTAEEKEIQAKIDIAQIKKGMGPRVYKIIKEKVEEYRKILIETALKPLVDSGYWEQSVLDKIQDKNEFYAGMRRLDKEGRLLVARKEGSELAQEDIYVQASSTIAIAQRLAANNKFLRTFHWFAEHPSLDLGITFEGDPIPIIDSETQKPIPPPVYNKETQIQYRHEGQYYTLNMPKLVLKTIKSMDEEEKHIIWKTLTGPAQVKRWLATTLNLSFNATNFPMDNFNAWLAYPGFYFSFFHSIKAGLAHFEPEKLRPIFEGGAGSLFATEKAGERDLSIEKMVNKKSFSQWSDEVTESIEKEVVDAKKKTTEIAKSTLDKAKVVLKSVKEMDIDTLKDELLKLQIKMNDVKKSAKDAYHNLPKNFKELSIAAQYRALEAIKTTIDIASIPSEILEGITREGAFLALKEELIEKGIDDPEDLLAMYIYNKITTDFKQRGTNKTFKNYEDLISFSRSKLSALWQMGRLLKQGSLTGHLPRKYQTTTRLQGWSKYGMALAGLTGLAGLVMYQANKDPEAMATLSDSEKRKGPWIWKRDEANNVIWNTNSDGSKTPQLIRIPLKHMMKAGWQTSLVTYDILTSQVAEDKTLTKTEVGIEVAKRMLEVGKIFNPVGDTPYQALGNITPDFIQPIAEVGLNRNFYFNYKIDYDKEINSGTPIEERMGRYRTAATSYISERLAALAKKGGLKGIISPAQVQHLLVGYFVEMGRVGSDLASTKLNNHLIKKDKKKDPTNTEDFGDYRPAFFKSITRNYFPNIKWTQAEIESFESSLSARQYQLKLENTRKNKNLGELKKAKITRGLAADRKNENESKHGARLRNIMNQRKIKAKTK